MSFTLLIEVFIYWTVSIAAIGALFWYAVSLPALKRKGLR